MGRQIYQLYYMFSSGNIPVFQSIHLFFRALYKEWSFKRNKSSIFVNSENLIYQNNGFELHKTNKITSVNFEYMQVFDLKEKPGYKWFFIVAILSCKQFKFVNFRTFRSVFNAQNVCKLKFIWLKELKFPTPLLKGVQNHWEKLVTSNNLPIILYHNI